MKRMVKSLCHLAAGNKFHEFARYFQNLGCREALYLNGFVSRMYLPEENFEQLDGDFAVMIGVTE